MDEEVEKELSNLVKILIETVPSLNSVRLFGSYLNGKWNPKTSDIDILVCINDEHYSVYKDRTKDWDDITGYFSIIGSEQRRNLRENIENKLNGKHKDRFSLAILSKKDVRDLMFCNEGRGNLGLYQRTLIFYLFVPLIDREKHTILVSY